MSFETWWKDRYQDGPIYFSDVKAAWTASHTESEAQIATALAELRTVRAQQTSMILEMSTLRSERDALREALKLARTRIAHKFDCLAINPTEEWPEKGSTNFDGCCCEIAVIDAALSIPASGEPARKP